MKKGKQNLKRTNQFTLIAFDTDCNALPDIEQVK